MEAIQATSPAKIQGSRPKAEDKDCPASPAPGSQHLVRHPLHLEHLLLAQTLLCTLLHRHGPVWRICSRIRRPFSGTCLTWSFSCIPLTAFDYQDFHEVCG